MMERRPCKDQAVDYGDRHAGRHAGIQRGEQSTYCRAMQVQRVFLPAVDHRNDKRLAVLMKTYVREERRIKNRMNVFGVTRAAFFDPSQLASSGTGHAHKDVVRMRTS